MPCKFHTYSSSSSSSSSAAMVQTGDWSKLFLRKSLNPERQNQSSSAQTAPVPEVKTTLHLRSPLLRIQRSTLKDRILNPRPGMLPNRRRDGNSGVNSGGWDAWERTVGKIIVSGVFLLVCIFCNRENPWTHSRREVQWNRGEEAVFVLEMRPQVLLNYTAVYLNRWLNLYIFTVTYLVKYAIFETLLWRLKKKISRHICVTYECRVSNGCITSMILF